MEDGDLDGSDTAQLGSMERAGDSNFFFFFFFFKKGGAQKKKCLNRLLVSKRRRDGAGHGSEFLCTFFWLGQAGRWRGDRWYARDISTAVRNAGTRPLDATRAACTAAAVVSRKGEGEADASRRREERDGDAASVPFFCNPRRAQRGGRRTGC